MVWADYGSAFTELHDQHFVVIDTQGFQRLFPAFGLGDVAIELFDLVNELVIQELVQKHLGDDFELITIIAQAVVSADAFQVVDQGFGLLLKLLCLGHSVKIKL